jgi:hypothetical protein
MIVLGADTHKSSHTIAGIAATAGAMLGDKTVGDGVRGFDQVLQWARGFRRDRRCGRSSIPSLGARRDSGDCPLSGRGPTLSTIYPGSRHDAFPMCATDSALAGPGRSPCPAGPRPLVRSLFYPMSGRGCGRRRSSAASAPEQLQPDGATSAGGTLAAPG